MHIVERAYGTLCVLGTSSVSGLSKPATTARNPLALALLVLGSLLPAVRLRQLSHCSPQLAYSPIVAHHRRASGPPLLAMAPSPPPPDDDSSTSPASPLAGVRAILYDQFGTLTDWESSVSGQLAGQAERGDQGGGLSDSSGGAGASLGLQNGRLTRASCRTQT